MLDLEAQWYLKDCLIHGVCKHIHDSVQYLYSTPGTSYSQLMVVAQKVESKNEETQEKDRPRAMVTTDPGEGMAELGQQIAKLMAYLIHTRQGSGPSSAPGSPLECGCGWGHSGRGIPSHPSSFNGRGGPGQMTLAHSLPRVHGVEGLGSQGSDQGNMGPVWGGSNQSLRPTLSPVF